MKILISFFIKFINIFTKGGEPFRLLLFLGFIGLINVAAIVLQFDDLSLVASAQKYQIPSTLYGIGEKGEYEPVAEFYQFSKVVVDLKELEKQ